MITSSISKSSFIRHFDDNFNRSNETAILGDVENTKVKADGNLIFGQLTKY